MKRIIAMMLSVLLSAMLIPMSALAYVAVIAYSGSGSSWACGDIQEIGGAAGIVAVGNHIAGRLDTPNGGHLFLDKVEREHPYSIASYTLVVQIDGDKIYLCSDHHPDTGTAHEGYCDVCGRNSSGNEYDEGSSDDNDKEEVKKETKKEKKEEKPAEPTPHQVKQDSIYNEIETQVASIGSSSNGNVTIDGKDLVNSLPRATMQKIAENPNVDITFTYIYNGVKYTTVIPAGAKINTSIDWFGPAYLMANYPTVWHKTESDLVHVISPVK